MRLIRRLAEADPQRVTQVALLVNTLSLLLLALAVAFK